jgi:hypothetical protein
MADICTINSAIERGCGTRAEGGLYVCVPTSSTGIPVEAFVIDPPIPWSEGPFRGARLHKRSNGVTDLLLWVGAEYYPTIADFIVEGSRHGFSKRVPTHREADYSVLTSDSRILLVHPRAIVTGTAPRRRYGHPDSQLHVCDVGHRRGRIRLSDAQDRRTHIDHDRDPNPVCSILCDDSCLCRCAIRSGRIYAITIPSFRVRERLQ